MVTQLHRSGSTNDLDHVTWTQRVKVRSGSHMGSEVRPIRLWVGKAKGVRAPPQDGWWWGWLLMAGIVRGRGRGHHWGTTIPPGGGRCTDQNSLRIPLTLTIITLTR